MRQSPPKPKFEECLTSEVLSNATHTVAATIVGDAISRFLKDSAMGWPAALSVAIASAGVINPLTVGAVLMLATVLKVKKVIQNRQD
ncbi:MAG: hypothetical protein AAGH92_11460 [Planctomycetota bacterium]